MSAVFGRSNQSCSAYTTVAVEYEHQSEGDDDPIEDGELVSDEIKVRFSDHPDRYGADIDLRITDRIETIEDNGEYVATDIAAEDYNDLLERAWAEVTAKVAKYA